MGLLKWVFPSQIALPAWQVLAELVGLALPCCHIWAHGFQASLHVLPLGAEHCHVGLAHLRLGSHGAVYDPKHKLTVQTMRKQAQHLKE